MAEKIDTEGWSNLHHAVAKRFTNLIHSLLEQLEETVNMPDGQGRTPLHLACSDIEGNSVPQQVPVEEQHLCLLTSKPQDLPPINLQETEQIIELLLSHGADPTILDKTGRSPLHCLVDHWLTKQSSLGKSGNKIISFFVIGGANFNEKDVNGRTVLHYVAGSPDMVVPVAIRKHERITNRGTIMEMIPNGEGGVVIVRHARPIPEVEIRPQESNKPTYTAKDQLYMKELLVKLLNSGADINARDNKGNTPLHLAITANKFDIVKELIVRKANVNVKNCAGQTPLHLAVEDSKKFEHYGILLLHKGALANIIDERGLTPVDIIRYREDFPCFLKHLILLIDVKIHPEMHINTGDMHINTGDMHINTGDNLGNKSVEIYQKECKDLKTYFELNGQSLLPLLLRPQSLPFYTENDLFQTNINRDGFSKRFPNYSLFLKYKFLQDQNRLNMIKKCTAVFCCFGGNFHYTDAGRLAYTRNANWESLPEELKLRILSFLTNDDLEYLEKNLFLQCYKVTSS